MSVSHTWFLVALAGCGRLSFDPVAVADDAADADVQLANHDEDGDGVDDAIDTCPHLSDPGQDDLDADGVGDVCDPEPSLPNQSRAVFLAMTAGSAPVPNVDWEQRGDAWRFSTDGSSGAFDVPAALANADIWIGFDLVAMGPSPRQMYAAVVDASPRYYYGEIYDDGTMSPRETLLYFDGSLPVFFGSSPSSFSLGTSVPLGFVSYHLMTRTLPSPQVELDMAWSSMQFHNELNTADAANFVGGDVLHFVARSITIEVRYIFVVTTGP